MTATRSGLLTALALAASAWAIVGDVALPGATRASQNPGAGAPNPLANQRWWDQRTPWNPTWNSYRSLSRRGRAADAAKVLMLARTPQFKWFGM